MITIEQLREKAKAYDEALRRAKYYHDRDNIQFLENVFPELKESKDERIRKAVIEMIHDTPNVECEENYNVRKEDVLAWLEKQGEQNPSWSEEDERNLKGIIDEIEANKNNAPDYDHATYDRFLSWIKSLRPQNRWKPSEEQMKALHDLNLTGNISYAGQAQALIDLYNSLKSYGKEEK